MTRENSGRPAPPGAWRLLAPALLVWAFAAVAVTYPGLGGAVACGAALLGTLALLLAVCNTRSGAVSRAARVSRTLLRYGAVSCAVLVLVGAQIAAGERARSDPHLAELAAGSEETTVIVTMRGFVKAQHTHGVPRAWAEAAVDSPSGEVPVILWLSGELVAEARGVGARSADARREGEVSTPEESQRAPPWAPGTRLQVSGSLVPLEPGSNAAYGVSVEAAERITAVHVTALPAPTVFGYLYERAGSFAADLRLGLTDSATRVHGAELVPGFAVGDTALVGPELERRMQQSSLTHVIAVSGANCALIVTAGLWIASCLGCGRRLRIVLAAGMLAGFVGVVGPDTSVQRAAVMATVVLVSNFGGKRAVALPALGIAMIVLLVANPWQALQPGFSLSVSATAGILLLVPGLERALRTVTRAPAALTLPVSVAFAAQLACGPLLLFVQSGVPAIGVLANVIAGPAVPLGTALGVISLVMLPLSEPIGHFCTLLASLPARWVAATAEVTAQLPLARWPWPEGWGGAILLAVAEVSLLLAWAVAVRRIRPHTHTAADRAPWRAAQPLPLRSRVVVGVLLSCGIGVLSGPLIVSPIVERTVSPRDWSFVACDVGQGDALLLRSPQNPGTVMLVDTGDEPELLSGCLERFGVRRISLLVLTHDDRDHVGALDSIIDTVDAAIVAPHNTNDGEERPVLRALAAAGVPFEIGGADGRVRSLVSGLSWETIAPDPGRTPPDTNAASVVMRVYAGEMSVLLLADTGEEEQLALMRAHSDLHATVSKIAHHGSRDQAPGLPARVGAEIAVVSVGADNSYGHPTEEALSSYAETGAHVLRTDVHGSIAISGGPGSLRVWTERGGDSDPDSIDAAVGSGVGGAE